MSQVRNTTLVPDYADATPTSRIRSHSILMILVPLILLISAVVLLWLPPTVYVRDGDTLWHIRTGEWIISNWAVPTHDFYSYTANGKPWVDGEWLSEVIFSRAYEIAGWRGVLLTTLITCATIVALLGRYLLANLRFSAAIGWTTVTAMLIFAHFLARPHIFSYLLFLTWIPILLDHSDRTPFNPPRLTLCVMMVLWSNLHGSFILGLIFLWIFTVCDAIENWRRNLLALSRPALVTAVLVSCCALINPYGVKAALLSLEVSRMSFVLDHIGEWKTPPWHTLKVPLVLFLATALSPLAFKAKITSGRLLSLFLLMFLALSYFRGLIMFFLLAPLILARPLAASCSWLGGEVRARDACTDPVITTIVRRGTVILSCAMAALFVSLVLRWEKLNTSTPSAVAAIDFVKKHKISGNVFHSEYFGAYLIWRGIPDFIDSRTPPFSDAFAKLAHDTEALVDMDTSLKTLDDYHISWLLLVPSSPLGKALKHLGGWQLIYSDNTALIYTRK